MSPLSAVWSIVFGFVVCRLGPRGALGGCLGGPWGSGSWVLGVLGTAWGSLVESMGVSWGILGRSLGRFLGVLGGSLGILGESMGPRGSLGPWVLPGCFGKHLDFFCFCLLSCLGGVLDDAWDARGALRYPWGGPGGFWMLAGLGGPRGSGDLSQNPMSAQAGREQGPKVPEGMRGV